MEKEKEKWIWRWSEKGLDSKSLAEEAKEIPSPYKADKPPFCYPGTTLSMGAIGRAKALIAHQINAIGSHTHIEIGPDGKPKFRPGEGGFEKVQRIEAAAVWMVASVLGGSPKTIDGYFCGGGTEANIEGLWIGREWLRKCPDPMAKGIAVLTTQLAHYSIAKAVELLDLGHHQWVSCTRCGRSHLFMPDAAGRGLNLVGMDEKGQMSIEELERIFRRKYEEGFRRFLIVPTVGTCLMGSIDPIEKIGEFIRETSRKTGVYFYTHVDASLAGFTVPFVNPKLPIGFLIPEVMSMTVDGDKMGQLPYPAGIFLCRKDLMSLVARKVNYGRGNEDDTVCGSRSCLAPVLAWYIYQTEGMEGQREYVQRCLDNRDKLVELVKQELPWVKILPCSPWVNFAPMEIDIEGGEVPEDLRDGEEGMLAPYHLRSDFFPTEPADPQSCPRVVYKVCIMPHHNQTHLETFVGDIGRADEEWKKSKEKKVKK